MNWIDRNITGSGVISLIILACLVSMTVWAVQVNIRFKQYLAKNKLVYVQGYSTIKPTTIIYEDYKKDN